MELGPLGQPEPIGLEQWQFLVEVDRLAALVLAPELAELAVAELAVAELAVAELAVVELAVVELAVVELAVVELAVAELAVAELAVVELELAVERCLGDKPQPTRQLFLRKPAEFVATQ